MTEIHVSASLSSERSSAARQARTAKVALHARPRLRHVIKHGPASSGWSKRIPACLPLIHTTRRPRSARPCEQQMRAFDRQVAGLDLRPFGRQLRSLTGTARPAISSVADINRCERRDRRFWVNELSSMLRG